MNKIVLVPDSFKGTMSSAKICEIMKDSILRFFPDIEVVSIPIADGGEGSADSLVSALAGRKVSSVTCGPYFEEMVSHYGIVDGDTAVMDMSSAAGLHLAGTNRNAGKTTTFGVGRMISHALDNNCRKIILGLGGSATNDGGCGAAAALGAVFRDRFGNEFIPVGETLKKISEVDISKMDSRLYKTDITAMCDVDIPLFGSYGAARIFAPQKGADEKMVEILEEGLVNLSAVIKRDLGIDISYVSGSGAAGGMGAGIMAFLKGKLKAGIDVMLDLVNFDILIDSADCIFTGEGSLDSQTLRGKAVMGIAKRALKKNIPVIAVVGNIGSDIDDIFDYGVSAVFSINRTAVPLEVARPRAISDLSLAMDNIMRLIKLGLN
ncbi:MAG: glycerate kinase [Ruminococcaceae bacterium]|nr:glycerate kinase [Oscillospiraceae bacterium]